MGFAAFKVERDGDTVRITGDLYARPDTTRTRCERCDTTYADIA